MRAKDLVILTMLAALPSWALQESSVGWWQHALGRRGLHHARVQGRFVTPQGAPAGNVRVQLTTGSARQWPLAEAVSGADGRFEFADVNAQSLPGMRWYPPDGWMTGTMGLPGDSGGTVHVGDILLQPDTVVRVVTQIVGEEGLDKSAREPTVVLIGASNGPRIGAQKAGELLLLRQIPFREGTWEVMLFSKGHSETFRAPYRVAQGRRDRLVLLRLLRNTLQKRNQYLTEGKLEVAEVIAADAPGEREFAATGQVVDPDGNPVEGAIVGVADLLLNRMAPAWTRSGAGGMFELRYRATECHAPILSFGGTDDWSAPNSSDGPPCESKWAGRPSVTLPAPVRLTLQATGLPDPSQAKAYWWHPSLGWQPFSSLQSWIPFRSTGRSFVVKVEAPGYVPIVKTLETPGFNKLPPSQVDAAFSFDGDAVRQLVVRSGDHAIAGATVDVESVEDLDRDKRQPFATYTTDRSGSLKLAGSATQRVELFVYADGYEPARAVWTASEVLTIDLRSRSATLAFPSMRPHYTARIWAVGRPGSARTFRRNVGESAEIQLAAGAYDIVIYSDMGQPLSGQRITLAPRQRLVLDPAVDTRPRLVVRYPSDGWTASVTDSTPAGMPSGWAAYSSAGGQFAAGDVAAALEREMPQESVFRLSRAGTVNVQVACGRQPHQLWRAVDLAAGQTVTLDVPAGGAVLQGSMRTYTGGSGFSQHGWAGPRMQLIAVHPQSWSVTVPMPPRDGEHTFTLRNLPAGDYYVYQHLIGQPKTYTGPGGREQVYSVPVNAWGGIPVTLEDEKTAHLNDFADYPFQDVEVALRDTRGRPVSGAVLRVRDRMSDAWRQTGEGPTTLAYASDPIPYPPAAVVENGRAKLPSIRAGRLELQLEYDDGFVRPLSVDVSPPSLLEITVPQREERQ